MWRDAVQLLAQFTIFCVIPLAAKTKEPLLQNWPRRASSDPAVIRQWDQQNPDANVGVLASVDGIWILDVDCPLWFLYKTSSRARQHDPESFVRARHK